MLYTRKFDFKSGTVIVADQIDLEFNEIATVLNGAISTENLAANCITVEKLTDSINPEQRALEILSDGVSSGLTITPTSGWTNLIGSITAGIAYVSGRRVSTSLVSNHAFTASKDTYIDLDKNGNFYYVEAALGAAEPAFTANSVRIAMVITDATKIVRVYDRRPWQWIKVQANRGASGYGTEAAMFHNSWVDYDANWEQAWFMKDQQGWVHLRGLIRSGTVGAAAFVMPKGFRIKNSLGTNYGQIFVVDAGGAFGRLDVSPDGFIKPTSGSNGYVSLATVRYKGEQ